MRHRDVDLRNNFLTGTIPKNLAYVISEGIDVQLAKNSLTCWPLPELKTPGAQETDTNSLPMGPRGVSLTACRDPLADIANGMMSKVLTYKTSPPIPRPQQTRHLPSNRNLGPDASYNWGADK